MSLSVAPSHDDRIAQLLDRLGYTQDDDFMCSPDRLPLSQVSHAVEAAFDAMGVIGVFCPTSSLGSGYLRRVPVVYMVRAGSRAEADAYHRAIWSQSVVPLVVIATPDFVQVRNGFDPAAKGGETSWSAVLSDRLPEALVSLTAANLRSAASWKDFGVSSRVDERIGRAIEALSLDIRKDYPELNKRVDTINGAIGRFLYLYMLVDRGILDQGWIDSLTLANGRPACAHIRLNEGWAVDQTPPAPWPAREIWLLFDAIDDVLNGSIFPIPITQRRFFHEDALHLIRRALRADVFKNGEQQYGFIDVNYATIRTETVSAIYECFFELETDGNKAEKGAYYTPPFLVDYIIDEIDAIAPLTANSCVVDPACGSGAFLVGAFRRIVERERRQGETPDPLRLREILETTVMGIEIKQQAANVARFSLYLTMLDYIPDLTLATIDGILNGAKLFPDLRNRLVIGDTFRPLPPHMRRKATHVLGNPPWTPIAEGTPASGYRTRLLSCVDEGDVPFMAKNGSLAEAFFWRGVREICQSNGQIAFIMPTKAFIAPQAKWFPSAMASRVTLYGITNLAHFREHLFTNARAAATVIFASPESVTALNRPWRYSPKPTSQPVGKDGTPWAIVVDRGQVERFVQSDLLSPGHRWFRDLMLQPLDRMIAAMLEQHPEQPASEPARDDRGSLSQPLEFTGLAEAGTPARPLMNLGSFLERHGMRILVGDSPVRIGLPSNLVLNTKSNDFRQRLGLLNDAPGDYHLSATDLDTLDDRYKTLFCGPMILMTRNQSDHYLIDRPVAFSSSIQSLHFARPVVAAALRVKVLSELMAFFKTSVARYLLALFGRLWVFDQRRIETPDLNALPFPFETIEDLLEFSPSGMTDLAFTTFCRRAFGLDDDVFELAVIEHHDLREAYQDGRRPTAALVSPSDRVCADYQRVLSKSIIDLLPSSTVDVTLHETSHRRSNLVRVVVSLNSSTVVERIPYGYQSDLSPEAGICLQSVEDAVIADILKPDMRSAFTVERAYADALSVAGRIMTA